VAGVARLRVEADGYAPVERSVHVDAEGRDDEVVVLSPVLPQPPEHATEVARPPGAPPQAAHSSPVAVTTATPRANRAGGSWSLGVACAGVGLVGLEVGTAFGLDAARAKAEKDPHCSAGRCDSRGLDLDARARSSALVSDVSFGVGAVALAASAWLLWPVAHDARHLGVAPLLAPSSAGIGASGVW
jgi:hypothetical protein